MFDIHLSCAGVESCRLLRKAARWGRGQGWQLSLWNTEQLHIRSDGNVQQEGLGSRAPAYTIGVPYTLRGQGLW